MLSIPIAGYWSIERLVLENLSSLKFEPLINLIDIKEPTGANMKLIRCSYGKFNQQQIIGQISWPFFDLLVIHQGLVEIEIKKNSKIKLASGEALLIYPNTFFDGTVLSNKALASVQHFSLPVKEQGDVPCHLSWLEGADGGAKLFTLDCLLLEDIERSLSYNESLMSPGYIYQMQQHFLHLILGQLIRKKHENTVQSKYKYLINEMVESYTDKPGSGLSTEAMAAQVNLSLSHFRAEFVKLYGEPPQRFLLSIKMKKACQLLEQSQLPIKGISVDLGYDDISCFYRHFKKVIKTTPAIYRQQKQIIG